MIKILAESAGFDETSERLTDQTKMILRKSWLSDFQMLDICGQIICEEYAQGKPSTRTETQNTEN